MTSTGDGGETACDAIYGLAVSLAGHADQEADADANRMEHRRGQHEAKPIGHRGRFHRHLRAMDVAMEDGEEADRPHGQGDRGLDAEGDDRAEHDDRERDTGLDERHRHAHDAENAAKGHDRDEGKRHEPQRPAAELIGENTDQDHGELMIKAAERMHEAMHEPARGAHSGVSQSGGWNEAKHEECESKEEPLHG
jgi:hypothetical protein